jgi:hypothetical protein
MPSEKKRKHLLMLNRIGLDCVRKVRKQKALDDKEMSVKVQNVTFPIKPAQADESSEDDFCEQNERLRLSYLWRF